MVFGGECDLWISCNEVDEGRLGHCLSNYNLFDGEAELNSSMKSCAATDQRDPTDRKEAPG